MKYKEMVKKRSNMLYKTEYKQELEILRDTKKGKIRQKISNEVFDTDDSVADNSKLIALLLNIFSKLYVADFDKTKLDAKDKIVIDSLIEIVQNTKTRFSAQFQKEGYSLLSKLLKRQQQVEEIIATVYKPLSSTTTIKK